MKYFIIAGEASGDLHASNLMAALKKQDENADFCFLGGDLMAAQGGKQIRHYRDMAFMGIVPVLLHAKTVLQNIKDCKQSILDYRPDALILVDYPSFNLKMAQFVKENLPNVPVYYYISPKLWAWKEYRIKSIKKYVDKVYSILPFEVEWFDKRGYKVDYVGNPCVDAVSNRCHKNESRQEFLQRNHLPDRPIIALLSGSRVQEIKSCLPMMLEAASAYPDYQLVIAGAPSIEKSLYDNYLKEGSAHIVFDETYELLQQADMAVVTSGTATLETALLRVPQVVVYKMSGGWLFHRFLELFIRVDNISLVNLIANKRLVEELVIEEFTVENLKKEINRLLQKEYREQVLNGYDQLIDMLGSEPVSEKTARLIIAELNKTGKM
ncbi:MAG: lipid-A-disaccharide synthase [Paludibacteraceae bacterium]|nr:lipid-A-disaccharide synthase [Paludibacteraceae bacterium]